MPILSNRRVRLLSLCAAAGLALACAGPSAAAEAAGGAASLNQELLQRLEMLERRLNELGASESPPIQPQTATPPGGEETVAQAILDRLDALDRRLSDLETNAVLSEPETTVRQVTVYVDEGGNQYDDPIEGTRPVITYQRERVYRRQVISEQIEAALAGEAQNSISVGVSSVTTLAAAFQTGGPTSNADGHVYGVSQADITFLATSAALNTMFFADVVGIGGAGPDQEITALNLLNSQTARLSNNQLNLREAWIRTELFDQQLAVSVGQLDLTNYFDGNAVANDETTQFISDALVNNPVLGLSANGLGIAAIFDPKRSVNVKLGVQHSNPAATSLSTSLYSLAEIEYVGTPFTLPEGRYRFWFRVDNSTGSNQTGLGVSIDQKLTPAITLFGRYGSGFVGGVGRLHFYSGGLGFQSPMTFNPLDRWGIGYAQTEIVSGSNEKLAEGFYNLHLTEHLSLSFLLQYVLESQTREHYLLPGMRMGVGF